MAKVLVLGNDTGACLGVIRSLGRRGVEVHAANSERDPATAASRHLAATHDLPRYGDTGAAWLARMHELLAEHGFDLVVPTSDSSLMQLLRHQGELVARLAVPNRTAAEVFTDKWATRALAAELGVPVAPGALLDELAPAAPLAFPAVIKQRRSYECGGRLQKSPVRRVASAAELERALAHERFELIEQLVPGYCRGVSVLAREGAILAVHQHRRLQQEHPTGASCRRVSEDCDPRLLGWTRELVAATALTGVAMFEFRHDPRTGDDLLLEVNPRFWGSLPLAIEAGADFPEWLYAMTVEGRDPPGRIGSRAGVRKHSLAGEGRRFAEDLDRAATPADWLALVWRAVEACLRLVRGRVFDSWAADDPRPFAVERRLLLDQVRSYCTKLGPRLRRRMGLAGA